VKSGVSLFQQNPQRTASTPAVAVNRAPCQMTFSQFMGLEKKVARNVISEVISNQ